MQCHTVNFIWKLLYIFRVVLSPIIRSSNNCIYSVWYLLHRYCYPPLSWKSWNRSECAMGDVRHPKHTQTRVRTHRDTSLVLQQFLAEKSIPVITQPPYSPDFALSNFWLFPSLKMGLKGTRFATMEDIKWHATAELQEVSKEAFRRCFQQWQDRWRKCVHAQGSYFECD